MRKVNKSQKDSKQVSKWAVYRCELFVKVGVDMVVVDVIEVIVVVVVVVVVIVVVVVVVVVVLVVVDVVVVAVVVVGKGHKVMFRVFQKGNRLKDESLPFVYLAKFCCSNCHLFTICLKL